MTSYRTFTQSFSSLSVFIFDRDFKWFITRLQRKPFRGKFLLVGCTYQYASLAVFWVRPSMNPYSISCGHSPQYRQQSFELRTHRHTHFIRQCRNQKIRIFHRITQRNQRLLKSLFSHFVQSPSHGSPIRRHSNQFVVTHIYYKVLDFFPQMRVQRYI